MTNFKKEVFKRLGVTGFYAAIFTLYFLFVSCIIFFKFGGESFDSVSLIINIVTVIISLMSAFFAVKYFGLKSVQGRVISIIGSALFVWMLADVYWFFTDNSLVSFADFLYFAGYPMILVGVLYGLKNVDPNFFRSKEKMFIATFAILAVIAVYLYLFPLSWDNELPFLDNIVTSGYVIVDIALLVPIIFLVSIIISGSMAKPWIVMGFAMVLNIVGDLYYAINYETYKSGDLIDLTWYSAYLLFGFAFLMLRFEVEKVVSKSVRKTSRQKN